MTQFQRKRKRNLSVVERKEVKMEAICKTRGKRDSPLQFYNSFTVNLKMVRALVHGQSFLPQMV